MNDKTTSTGAFGRALDEMVQETLGFDNGTASAEEPVVNEFWRQNMFMVVAISAVFMFALGLVIGLTVVERRRDKQRRARISSSSNCSRGNEDHLTVLEDQNVDTNNKDTNDSIGSNEMNTNANADIISRYHQQYLTEEVVDPIDRQHSNNSNSVFTDYSAEITNNVDYNDPIGLEV